MTDAIVKKWDNIFFSHRVPELLDTYNEQVYYNFKFLLNQLLNAYIMYPNRDCNYLSIELSFECLIFNKEHFIVRILKKLTDNSDYIVRCTNNAIYLSLY